MRHRDTLVARLLALAWTALWFGGFAVSIWRAAGRRFEEEPAAVEVVRMTALVPVEPTVPPRPLPDEPAPRPGAPRATAPSALPPPGPRGEPSVGDTTRRDTGSAGPVTSAVPPIDLAPPAATCTGPCASRAAAVPQGSGPLGSQVERDSVLWSYERGALADAIRRGPRAPTAAERDSAIRDRAARATASEAAGRESSPTMGAGVKLGVGLPGGGPSAAERARNRRLDAEVRATLERIRARADSVRWARCDSIAKRDPRAAARDTLCTVAPR